MNITNKLNLPSVLVDTVGRRYNPDKNVISCTQLVDSPLIRRLTIEHWSELSIDVSDEIWKIVGSAVHFVIEKIKTKNVLKEEYLKVKEGDMTLTGMFDLYEEDGSLSDFKFTSVWTKVYESRIKDWERQLNVYAYLLSKHNFPVSKTQIIAIYRDWSKTKANEQGSDYPKHQAEIIPVQLWKPEVREKYIKKRLRLHTQEYDTYRCNSDERWQSQKEYKIIKKGNKRSRKNVSTLQEAEKFKEEQSDKDKLDIIKIPAKYKRCAGYCQVAEFCPLLKEERGGGQNVREDNSGIGAVAR